MNAYTDCKRALSKRSARPHDACQPPRRWGSFCRRSSVLDDGVASSARAAFPRFGPLRRANHMPVIKVDNEQYSLRPGPNRLGAGVDADVRVAGDATLGIQAIVEVSANA